MSGCAKNRRFSRLLLSVAILMCTTARHAHGWAQQHIGNEPLNELNYQQWKSIMPVINHESRVYHTWVNGNEHFYYRGGSKELNDILQKFAALSVDVPEVVLRPGPVKVMTFEKEPIGYNFLLHIQGGISRHKEEGTNVFDKYPTMTVFIDGDDITLERIKIPAGVALIEVADLRGRYLKGLYSKDGEVRGYACYFLAEVDVYNESNVLAIAKLLEDEDSWVRSMAAAALSRFGRKARPALPALRMRMQNSNERTRNRFQETIEKIEAAEDTTEAEEKHHRILKKISQFRKSLDRERSEGNTELKEKNTQKKVDKEKREPIYDPNADAAAQISDAIAKAEKDNKHILIVYGGNWCGWCYKLHDCFNRNANIKKLLRYEYELVMVDIRTNEDLPKRFNTEPVGYPYLTVLDKEGKVLVNQRTDPLEEGEAHDPTKVYAFLNEWKSKPLNAEQVYEQALALAQKENKRVFLHFGAPWCGWCHRLEDFLAGPDIAKIMSQDYILVKIDLDRMAGAEAIDKRIRKEGGGIPWFAILDAQGKVLITSEGPEGNIGYPVKPAEIAHFIHMIKETSRNITSGQISAIEKVLSQKQKK
ncbi:MAG: thioredoxin family protein [Phycisphaerae bacterium]|nr:thioredoxin family protein [Phycisphaerae bacterium]